VGVGVGAAVVVEGAVEGGGVVGVGVHFYVEAGVVGVEAEVEGEEAEAGEAVAGGEFVEVVGAAGGELAHGERGVFDGDEVGPVGVGGVEDMVDGVDDFGGAVGGGDGDVEEELAVTSCEAGVDLDVPVVDAVGFAEGVGDVAVGVD